MDKEMTGAEMVIEALADQGVEHVFGYPGGAVLPIYDALFQQQKVQHILVRHEQGAVHAAEGYARSTGKVGCVLVTSGPGATNAVTGLTDALMDSTPLVCLTGQVPTHLIGNDAFQECDTVGITRPCTKHNYLVKTIGDLPRVLHEAFHIAKSGRPGPVVVDIPKDIQFAKGIYSRPREFQHKGYRPKIKGDLDRIKAAIEIMRHAKRPLFYTGGGVVNSGPEASHFLRELVKLTGFPITSTLMGLGAYAASDPQWLGMLGMHGTYEANMSMHDCDVMICIGARFDDRITGRLDAFSPGSKKIHVDIDPSSINKNVKADLPIIGDCAHVLEDMVRLWRSTAAQADKAALEAWWKQIDKWRARRSLAYKNSNEVIKPQYAISRLYELTKDRDAYITTEVGQHQMWAAQFYRFEQPNRWMTSGGLGTMGYGLPAAVGVQLAHPNSLVIDIAGEASVLMTMQEMSTAVQYELPIKIFIINNQYMGMVRQWQELLHGGRYAHSYTEALPDFVKLAEAYHAVGIRCERPGDVDGAIREMLAVNRPVIFDCVVDPNENCFPMIPSGRAHNEMLLGDATLSVEEAITEEGKVMV
ncbi:MAG: acetolactate synthase 3 large subunit [Alphaproteobacteria bacterium]|nr:MAG: acetolactate synthase 3 large subunit [Alphaproteobacteria bacterium]